MKKQILLIDDEKDFTELTGTLLRFHDMDVDTYNDPLEVEKKIDAKQYDIVVTDIMMPDIDGFELIRRLKQKPNYKNTPIVVLSAKVITDEERKFLFQNNVSLLMKPFDPQGLVEHIAQILEQ